MSAHTFQSGDRAVVSDRDQGPTRKGAPLPVGAVVEIARTDLDQDGEILVRDGKPGPLWVLPSALDPLPDPADEVIVRASDLPEVTWNAEGKSWIDSRGRWLMWGNEDIDRMEADLLGAYAAVRAERARRAAEKPEPDPAQVEALAALMRALDGSTFEQIATYVLATGKVTVEVEP